MFARLFHAAAGLTLALALHVAHVHAAAGKIDKVQPSADRTSGGSKTPAQAGLAVSMGDRLSTGASGRVEVRLNDSTRLVVGPSASLVIDKYVSSGSKARRVAVNATAGVFRFITGNSAKSAYSIALPSATIGIRGTEFDFAVLGSGRSLVMHYSGQVRVCGTAGSCRTLREPCDMALVTASGNVYSNNDPQFVLRRNEARRSFPYAISQSRLSARYRIANAPRCGGELRSTSTSSESQERAEPESYGNDF